MNQVFFLVNGNSKIGSGHINRCLLIAAEFKNRNILSYFINFENDNHINNLLKEHQIESITIEKKNAYNAISYVNVIKRKSTRIDSALLIVDTDDDNLAQLDFQESIIGSRIALMYITVKNSMPYKADVILNQNIIAPTLEYKSTSNTKLLLGPRYFIVDKSLSSITPNPALQIKDKYNILVTFGNADPNNNTSKLLSVLKHFESYIDSCHVICGPLNLRINELRTLSEKYSFISLKESPKQSEMYEYMQNTDIAFTALGLTYWELILHNIVPAVISGSEREKNILNYLKAKNYCFSIGHFDDSDYHSKWKKALERLFNQHAFINVSHMDLSKQVNKQGVKLVVDEIISTLKDKNEVPV